VSISAGAMAQGMYRFAWLSQAFASAGSSCVAAWLNAVLFLSIVDKSMAATHSISAGAMAQLSVVYFK